MKDDLSLYISNTINSVDDHYSKLSVEEIKYMLNKIDIKIIEQFLRDKKLEKINLDGSK